MYRLLSLENLENYLREEEEVERDNGDSGSIGLMLDGNAFPVFGGSTQFSKLVCLLFADPEEPFVQNQILGSLPKFHFHSEKYLDFFCAGYCDNLDSNKFPNSRDWSKEIDGKHWEFSSKIKAEFIKELENLCGWNYLGETQIIFLEAKLANGKLALNTDKTWTLQLEKMAREGAIVDVKSLLFGIIKALKIKSHSKSSPQSLLKVIREQVLYQMPGEIREAYENDSKFQIKKLT